MKKLWRIFLVAGCSVVLLFGCGSKEEETVEVENSDVIEFDSSVVDELFKEFADGYIYIGEEDVSATGRLSTLLEDGFETDIDVEQKMASCAVSEEFSIMNGTTPIIVKVVNPYENALPISDCSVCYIRVEDTTGNVQDGNGLQCGTSSFEEVKDTYKAPYQEKDDELVYKANVVAFSTVSVFGEEGEKLIEDSTEREIRYSFENDVLNAIEIKAPALLYNGMQDNIAPEKLDSVSQEDMTGALEIKTDVLDSIIAAFNNAKLDIGLNETTGEVLMDTAVLFATDSYELSDEGKEYLDSFFNAYANAILSEENINKIAGIVFEGHTDTSGEYEYNLELSQKRAEAVLAYSLESTGNGLNDAQKNQIESLSETVGYSFSDPVYSEDGEVDMDASRRVAVKFYIAFN